MFYIYKILKSLLFPPGIVILFLVWIFLEAEKRHIRLLSLILSILLYTLSTHWGYILLKPLSYSYHDFPEKCDAVVVFGAGISDESISRMLKGCEISRKLNCPVIPSGYKVESRFMKKVGMFMDCEVSMIDTSSRNTYENVLFVKKLMDKGKRNLVIVSSDYHIRRIKTLLRKSDLDVSVVGVGFEKYHDPILRWFPSYGAFYENMKYLNEIIGTLIFSLKI